MGRREVVLILYVETRRRRRNERPLTDRKKTKRRRPLNTEPDKPEHGCNDSRALDSLFEQWCGQLNRGSCVQVENNKAVRRSETMLDVDELTCKLT